MKKSSIFMAVGTAVLAVTAVFATKANKKFTTFNTAFTTAGVKVVSVGNFTTVSTSGVPAYFATSVQHTLWTSTAGAHQLYFK